MVKQTVVHPNHMEHYVAIKRSELLIHTTAEINIQGITLSKKGVIKCHILDDSIYLTFLK